MLDIGRFNYGWIKSYAYLPTPVYKNYLTKSQSIKKKWDPKNETKRFNSLCHKFCHFSNVNFYVFRASIPS